MFRWLALCLVFVGATDARASGFAFEMPAPSAVTGKLTRADGRELRGARFRVEVFPEGTKELVAFTEDVDVTGQYTVRLPYPGRYVMRAYVALPGAGRYERVELEPVDGSQLAATFTSPAPVKDFRLAATWLQK